MLVQDVLDRRAFPRFEELCPIRCKVIILPFLIGHVDDFDVAEPEEYAEQRFNLDYRDVMDASYDFDWVDALDDAELARQGAFDGVRCLTNDDENRVRSQSITTCKFS